MEKQPATYAVRKTSILSSTIPRRITIGLVDHNAFDGSLSYTPFNFKPYRLCSISFHAGGHIFPQSPYNFDFPNALTRAYVYMFEALGMANSSNSIDISLKQFNSGWTFFVIPLTSTLDDSCGFELIK